MNTYDKPEQAGDAPGSTANGGASRVNDDSDIPGAQTTSKNPNPRANENLKDPSTENTDWENDDTANQVGTEITDGEDG